MTRRESYRVGGGRGGYLGLASLRSRLSPCLLSDLLLPTCPILGLSILRDRHLSLHFHPLNPTLYSYAPYFPLPLHSTLSITPVTLPQRLSYLSITTMSACIRQSFRSISCSVLLFTLHFGPVLFFPSFRCFRDISSACIIFCFQPHWHSVSMT